MSHMRRSAAALALLALVFLHPTRAAGAGSSYHIARRIALGGVGGWDYVTFDGASHRLFIARGDHVQVVDADHGKLVGDILGLSGVHGVAIAGDLGRGFISNGRDSSVTIFDLKSLATLSKVAVTGPRPDAILYDPGTHRVFTFNAKGANATAIDAAAGTVAGTVPLGGTPEAAVSDGRGKIFVNIEDTGEIVCFDARSLEVVSRHPLAPGERPTGLAFDAKSRMLFAGCHNRKLIVMDADSGRVIADLPIGRGVDGTAYDPGTRLAFASCGGGTLSVVREDAPGRYTPLADVTTAYGARTVALDPARHRLFLPTAEFGPAPPDTGAASSGRPVVPDTFFILVLER